MLSIDINLHANALVGKISMTICYCHNGQQVERKVICDNLPDAIVNMYPTIQQLGQLVDQSAGTVSEKAALYLSSPKAVYATKFLTLWQTGATASKLAEQLGIGVDKVKNDKKKFRKLYREWKDPNTRDRVRVYYRDAMASIDPEWGRDFL